MKSFFRLAFVCASIAAQGSIHAQEAPAAPAVTLEIGSDAPPLVNGEYVQGEAVKTFEKDKAYLIECWATWCGPCIASIPHVNELQQKFAAKGFTVIGQNVWENDVAKVAPFVKEMGAKMSYRVALDDTSDGSKGRMSETWLKAAGRNGIPSAFLVGKDQKIAWIGHPMQLDDETIEAVLDGKFDVAAAKKKDAEEKAGASKIQEFMKSARTNIVAKNWDEALKAADGLDALGSGLGKQTYLPDMLRIEVATKRPDLPAAVKLAQEFAVKQKNDPSMMGYISNMLMEGGKEDKPTLEAADKLLSEAAATKPEKSFQLLIQQARLKKALGDDAKATTLAKEAVEASPDNLKDKVKALLKEMLPDA